ncbi:MAG: hypothetical protein LBD48_14680, partial [Treponema sp.]|nr:hypothetical protein [Treponema sp.]
RIPKSLTSQITQMKEGFNLIDWKSKLSSRKFWVALAGWITSLLTAFNVTEGSIAQVSLIIAGIGSLAVYMLAESLTDKARANRDKNNEF